MIAFFRERRRLRVLDHLFLGVGLFFIGWVAFAIFIADRRDLFYAIPSLFGTASTVGRYFVHRVRALPAPVRDLRDGDPARRDRAWEVIAAHREELLGATVVWATRDEPPLSGLSREGVLQRLERTGRTDWRRALRVWLALWVPLAFAVFFATLLYTPDPTQTY